MDKLHDMVATSQEAPVRPIPDDFDDYRAYLRAAIAYLKHAARWFSFRAFSRRAGFASPNFLKLVAEGQRSLSLRSIARFARALGLDARERDVFEALVLFGQAATDADRNRYFQALARVARRKGTAALLSDAHFQVYSAWYVLPIREMMLLPDFRTDASWIAGRLYPPIRPEEAKRGLDLLESLGLAVRDEAGQLHPHERRISTGPVVGTLAVRNFHRAMLEKAAESLEAVPVDERDVTALSVHATSSQYQQIRDVIARTRAEILALLTAPPGAGQKVEVYHIGFQVFPVTRGPQTQETLP